MNTVVPLPSPHTPEPSAPTDREPVSRGAIRDTCAVPDGYGPTTQADLSPTVRASTSDPGRHTPDPTAQAGGEATPDGSLSRADALTDIPRAASPPQPLGIAPLAAHTRQHVPEPHGGARGAVSLGRKRDSADLLVDLPELLATRLLVQGNSGSGKSHLLRRLLEQTARLVQQAVVDPEGDFTGFATHYGHLVIDAADHTEATLRSAGERMRAHRASVVLNLENVEPDQQLRATAAFLGGMFDAPRVHWYPVLVVVDEAQLFAPVAGGDTTDEARKLSLGAMTNLMCRGRKRGLAGVIATQRLAKLAKNVAAEASNFLMGRTFLDIDMVRAADLLGMERRQAEAFRDLRRGQFVALGPALSRTPVHVTIGTVETASNATGPALLPLAPTTGEELRDVILEPAATFTAPPRARAAPAPDLLAQLAAAGVRGSELANDDAPTEASAAEPVDPARIDALIRLVAEEPDADFRPVATLYQDVLLRARIEGLGRAILDLAAFRRRLATIRSGISPEDEDEDWRMAEAMAWSLPDDVQTVFLLLAHAARIGAPCPDDAALARAYGTHSLGRARRQLAFLESRNVIVLREEASGHRMVALVGLGWQTAAR